MFEPGKTDNDFKRLAGAPVALPRRHTVILIPAVLLLVPFPTTVIN